LQAAQKALAVGELLKKHDGLLRGGAMRSASHIRGEAIAHRNKSLIENRLADSTIRYEADK
jgi:hypothetical protein